MEIVTNEVLINAPPAAVYRHCIDVDAWPRIFDTVSSVVSMPLEDDRLYFEMRVSNSLGEQIVRSHRRHIRSERRIDFELVSPPRPFAMMDGHWVVHANGPRSVLVIVHRFELAPSRQGASVATPSDAWSVRVYENTHHVLRQLK